MAPKFPGYKKVLLNHITLEQWEGHSSRWESDSMSDSDHADTARNTKKMCTDADDIGDFAAKSIMEQWERVFKTKIGSDCSFKVGPQDDEDTCKVIKAHKIVLAKSSPAFAAMLFGNVPLESSEEIRITDMLPHTFENMLQYLYCESISTDLEYDDLEGLILAADKYLITNLKNAAIKLISAFINFDSDCKWRCIVLADSINSDPLREICSKAFCFNTAHELENADFLNISRPLLVLICCQRKLRLTSDVPLIEACVCWAMHQCKQHGKEITGANIRERLGPQIVSKLRFLSLTSAEFAKGPGSEDWLTENEKFELIKAITNKSHEIDSTAGFCTIRNPRFKCDLSKRGQRHTF